MNRVGWITLAMLALATSGQSWAGTKDVVQKIEALNSSAISSFKSGDHDGAKALLMEALVLGKKNNLDTHPVLARTYLDLGVVQIDGFKDHEKAQRYFS